MKAEDFKIEENDTPDCTRCYFYTEGDDGCRLMKSGKLLDSVLMKRDGDCEGGYFIYLKK